MSSVGSRRSVIALIPEGVEQGQVSETVMALLCRDLVASSQVDKLAFTWEPRTGETLWVNGNKVQSAAVLWVEFDDTFNIVDRAIVTTVCTAFVRGFISARFPWK